MEGDTGLLEPAEGDDPGPVARVREGPLHESKRRRRNPGRRCRPRGRLELAPASGSALLHVLVASVDPGDEVSRDLEDAAERESVDDRVDRAEADGREWRPIHIESWPTVDESAIHVSIREVPVQVNGKLRDRIIVAADATEEQIRAEALASPRIQAILDGRSPERIVVAGGGKLVNVVLRD